ncbi:D-alanyl-D-alanine carboxypeptidase [Virgibacillus soli]|nr:D-alanyl-D-alanine carboxypeptidase [Virgibacillus soli]
MKIALWITVGFVVVVALVAGVGIWIFQKQIGKEDPEYIIQFLKENVDKGNVSATIHYNQEKWVQVNEDQLLPLASAVKTIIAIEYAEQAAAGKIDPNQEIPLNDLEIFYIPKTDGGAHQAWLKDVKIDQQMETVPLKEVTKGMIVYSSNANTEYLIHLLGLENINQTLEDLQLSSHEPIYPIVSALAIPQQIIQEEGSKKAALDKLKNMDMKEYRELTIATHKEWLQQPLNAQEKKQLIKDLNMDFQKVWSDRLPRATTAEYVSIMEKLNTKSHFSENVYTYLDPVMEGLMENPNNQEWLAHAGQKGGSTAFVLTMAMYATDQEGNQTELALFANDLSTMEQIKLSKNMNAFQLKFLTDEDFRKKVKKVWSQ